MPKTTAKKAATGRETAKPKRLSTAEIFAWARQYEDAAKAVGAAGKLKTEAQRRLTDDLLRRKTRSLESDKHGPFTRVTLVQNESVEYDESGLYGALRPAQKRLAYDRFVNLNALSADARKRVIQVLTKDELAAVTTYSLNVEKLSAAVQAKQISAKLVAKFARMVKAAPYIRISHGKGE